MPKQLDVWLLGEHVGTLLRVDGRLNFAYRPEWLTKAAAATAQADAAAGASVGASQGPLSQSLPLRAEPFDDRATRPFFAGLLPEGDKRRLVAQALRASRQNDFALLDGIGGECAGAVTLLEPVQSVSPPDAPPNTPPNISATADPADSVRWLDEPALLHLLDEMPLRPMLAGQAGLRLSLAGAQDKLPVVVAGGHTLAGASTGQGDAIGLPLDGTPSTHILKPAIAGVDGSVFNETFCMTLAAALKLSVAPVAIRQVADRPVLLVQRYDRLAVAATPKAAPGSSPGASAVPARLHQEDFCQALGVVPEHKYQNEGGLDLAQAFELLRRATRPSAPQILKLLDAVVFNALIGNHDAHGKNFSLLYGPQGAVLAPLYDLLCTAVYPQLTDKMAMKIGGKYRFSELMARHWAQFARSAGLSPAQVRRRILEIAHLLPDLARQTQARMDAQGHGHGVLAAIVALISQRCALTVTRLTAPAAGARADPDNGGDPSPDTSPDPDPA